MYVQETHLDNIDTMLEDLVKGSYRTLIGGPYIAADDAAHKLGVPLVVVVEDIEEGMKGAIPSLIGASYYGAYIVPLWEVSGERLHLHRKRLTPDSGDDGNAQN